MKTRILAAVILGSAVFSAGCKVMDAADSTISLKDKMGKMLETTQDMQNETKKLTAGMHKQKLGEAIKMMIAADNYKYDSPTSPLLAATKTFAQEGTPDEIVLFAYALLKEINTVDPDPGQGTENEAGETVYTRAYQHTFDREKRIKVFTLQAISGQAPQSIIEQIVAQQLSTTEGAGQRHETTALAILMARAMFISSFHLEAGVFKEEVNNVGKLDAAYEYARQLQYLDSSPYVDQIRFKLDDTCFIFNEKLKKKLLRELRFRDVIDMSMIWENIADAVEKKIPDAVKKSNTPEARRVSEIAQEVSRIRAAK